MAIFSKLPYTTRHKAGDSESENGHLLEETSGSLPGHRKSLYSKPAFYVALLVISNIIFLFLGISSWVGDMARNSPICTEKDHSSYSPLFDRLNIKRTQVRLNNTFWPDANPSIYQMRPSAAVDAAWARLADTKGIAISGAEVRALGYEPDAVWPWPAEDAGTDAYMGLLDVFHQVHCLDSLRRAAFPEYYGDLRAKFAGGAFPFEDHMLHCQYVLLRNILCHADAEVVVFQKVEGFRAPFANFAVDKQCRNWDDILEWKEANEIVPKDWEASQETPAGIHEVPAIGLAVPYEETGRVSFSVF